MSGVNFADARAKLGMLKKFMVWGAVAAVIVAAAMLVKSMDPVGAPDVVAVLEQAPLPLPTDPLAGLEELQREVRLPQEPAAEQQVAVLAATASEEPASGAATDGSRRFLFDCGNGITFAVRTMPGEASVRSAQVLGADAVTLPQAEASAGARYTDGTSLYWSRGGLATFEIRGRSFADCTSSPGAAPSAEVRGRSATFRARGNEPSWILEIAPQQLTVITELGERRTEFPYRDPTVAGARTTYRSFAGTQELVVAIDRVPCSDTMSGELFDNTVTVTFEDATLYGCGRGL